MKKLSIYLLIWFLVGQITVSAQWVDFTSARMLPVQVSMKLVRFDSVQAIRVTKDTSVKKVDEATFVKFPDIGFHNGVLEVKVLSRLLPDAPPLSRGFIGLAFRIGESDEKFECIYIRPGNGRANEQIRRNHSTQYFSFPDFKFDRLREESPGVYESYADMGLNEWIPLRIEVEGSSAKLYIHSQREPCLVVNDLKLGATQQGAIGLFVDVGTEGFFRDLQVIKKN